jgi:hypothetical protein
MSHEEAQFALAFAKLANECAGWLDRECGEDKALRARLEALLAAHEQSDMLLATQAEAARPAMSSVKGGAAFGRSFCFFLKALLQVFLSGFDSPVL